MSTLSSALLLAPLKPRDRHFATRFSYGHSTALEKQVRDAGGGRAWFEKQLNPSKIKDAGGDKVKDWYPNLWYSPNKLFYRNYHSDVIGEDAASWNVMANMGRWTMMRRVHTSRQLHELMTEFWSNLLHVPLGDDQAWPYRMSYDAMIRKHALGRFDEMLQAATTHPSMGLYLDNATSTKDAPNENLGRELLELHSVGVDAGYTEDDVQASAKMLTGYRVDLYVETVDGSGDYDGVRSLYDTTWHHTGKLTIMDFSAANKKADGRDATAKYISYLAHHPKTAKRIARRLCVRFVHDAPSANLVNTVAKAWTRSGTDIKATLRALVAHPEFASSEGAKVRMPLEETIATIRALGIKPRKPVNEGAFANDIYWVAQGQGMTPYSWPTPDGFPEEDVPWSSPGRALDSLNVQRELSQQWWPTEDAQFPSDKSWCPDLPAKFGDVVDFMGKRMLGKAPTPRLRDAMAQRVGIPLTQRVTWDDLQDEVKFMLMILLGSPAHMTR